MKVSRRFEFDAGHRIPQHAGKCRHYHGHRYAVEVVVAGPLRDGMVVDFGEVKTVIGAWIDEHWDHGMILEQNDPMIAFLQSANSKVWVAPAPPTAEYIAKELLRVSRLLLSSFDVVGVTCYETPNCKAVCE